jgi:hypothetical protein
MNRSIRRVGWIGLFFILTFGATAAMERPSQAQVTETCWREYCTIDPTTKKKICVSEEIDCP